MQIWRFAKHYFLSSNTDKKQLKALPILSLINYSQVFELITFAWPV